MRGLRSMSIVVATVAASAIILAAPASAKPLPTVSKGSVSVVVPGTGELYFDLNGKIALGGRTYWGSASGSRSPWSPTFQIIGYSAAGDLVADCKETFQDLVVGAVGTLDCMGTIGNGPPGVVSLKLLLPTYKSYPQYSVYRGQFAG